MQSFDPEQAARVWQRVHPNTPPLSREEELAEMIAREWTDAATYLLLSRKLAGKDSTILRTMYQQEQSHCACLKGIYTLITGTHPAVPAVPPAKEDIATLLRRCYGQEMHTLAQYEARVNDPEYGQVFARLAVQEREHCRLVLELLGRMKKK